MPINSESVTQLKNEGYNQTQIAKLLGVSRQRVHQILNPEQHKARSKAHYHIKNGDIPKPEFCEQCGSGGTLEAHHPDYSDPLTVQWLCLPCHGKTRLKRKDQRNSKTPMKVNTYIWVENESKALELKKLNKWGESINKHLKALIVAEIEAEAIKQPLTKKAK